MVQQIDDKLVLFYRQFFLLKSITVNTISVKTVMNSLKYDKFLKLN